MTNLKSSIRGDVLDAEIKRAADFPGVAQNFTVRVFEYWHSIIFKQRVVSIKRCNELFVIGSWRCILHPIFPKIDSHLGTPCTIAIKKRYRSRKMIVWVLDPIAAVARHGITW